MKRTCGIASNPCRIRISAILREAVGHASVRARIIGAPFMGANPTIPVVLDTDIGSDIDDALALAYLLKQRRCDLLGITTVTGDVARRCAIADVVCRAVGRDDVPIHAGASSVLLVGPGQPNVPHYSAIEHLPHRRDWPGNTALDFLRQTIRARPGEITLLTIGPFTNIALLFAADPEIPSLLKGMVSMAGVFNSKTRRRSRRPREWNCLVDPIATAIVYNTQVGGAGHTSIGLDVTLQCTMPADEVRKRFVRPPLDIVLKMAEVWFAERDVITFHDPLAAAFVFDPQLCVTATGEVLVPLSASEQSQGRTEFTASPVGRHRVASSVDASAFFAHFFDVFA